MQRKLDIATWHTLSVPEESVCTYASDSVPDSEAVVPGPRERHLSTTTQSQYLHLLGVGCEGVSQFARVDIPHPHTPVEGGSNLDGSVCPFLSK